MKHCHHAIRDGDKKLDPQRFDNEHTAVIVLSRFTQSIAVGPEMLLQESHRCIEFPTSLRMRQTTMNSLDHPMRPESKRL